MIKGAASLIKGKVIIVVIVVASFAGLYGCGFLRCFDSDALPPDILLDESEYVFIGDLMSVDTLMHLGRFSYLGSEEEFYIIEYSFAPIDLIKGDKHATNIKFWYLTSIRLNSNYDYIDDFKAQKNTEELVYGNRMRSHDDILGIMDPYSIVDQYEIADMLKDHRACKYFCVSGHDVYIVEGGISWPRNVTKLTN